MGLEIMFSLFGLVLILCVLSLMQSSFKIGKKKNKHSYFIDADYRNSIFYDKKDEHHM